MLGNVKVVLVFWGTADSSFTSSIKAFYQGVTNSKWFDVLSEYSISGTTIGRGSVYSTLKTITTSATSVTQSHIEDTLKQFTSSGFLPSPDQNTYYAIHVAPGITVDTLGSGCSIGCNTHDTVSNGSQNINYGILPDYFIGGCSNCGSTEYQSSGLLAAAVTDSGGSTVGWYDSSTGLEVDTICEGQTGKAYDSSGTAWTVPKLWSNKASACVDTPPNPAPTTTSSDNPSRQPSAKPTSRPSIKPTIWVQNKWKTYASELYGTMTPNLIMM